MRPLVTLFYLEYTSAELCHRLRAPVVFHADGRYELGELLPSAIAKMRKIYSSGREAASSWGQRDALVGIVNRASAFSRAADASNAEQWQVNAAVHYNSWDNLGQGDFAPVAKAFQELLAGFTCPDCGEYLCLSSDQEYRERLHCDCGKSSINLCKKGS